MPLPLPLARPLGRRRGFAGRSRATVLVLVTALSGLVGAAGAARAATTDNWSVPTQASITIDGHGYGHGHGMSQYGAEGAARSGLDYRAIVRFYYPGTDLGAATGRISVLISADTSDDLVVLARPGLRVRDTGAGTVVDLPDNGATRWKLSVGPDGSDRVSFLTDSWQEWAQLKGTGEFAAGGAPITLVTPAGTRAYRGRLASRPPFAGSNARDTVNLLTLENYVRGVVPLEIPALWNAQAVQAQSVAARTYAAYQRAHPRANHYQICDTSSCQVYGGYTAEHAESNAAVNATRQQVLLASGQPAFTQFGSSSGGWTAAGSAAYLAAQQDPYDGWAGNPVHDWSVQIGDAKIEKAWPAIGDLSTITVDQRDGNGDWGGRVRTLTLVGSKGKVSVSGDTFRSALGMRSTWFTFRIG